MTGVTPVGRQAALALDEADPLGAGLHVRQLRASGAAAPADLGWQGRRDPFELEPGYVPAQGIRAFLSGTPPVLALAAVEQGVRVVADAGIGPIRSKAIQLTELAVRLAAPTRLRQGARGYRSPMETEDPTRDEDRYRKGPGW